MTPFDQVCGWRVPLDILLGCWTVTSFLSRIDDLHGSAFVTRTRYKYDAFGAISCNVDFATSILHGHVVTHDSNVPKGPSPPRLPGSRSHRHYRCPNEANQSRAAQWSTTTTVMSTSESKRGIIALDETMRLHVNITWEHHHIAMGWF